MVLKKILIIRFSSIGDIVLTTPVLRCLKQQVQDAEIHYCLKKQYAPVMQANPYIDKLHLFDGSLGKLAENLRAEQFDYIIDLHNSLRSGLLKMKLHVPSNAFPKLNIEKWLLVNLKINRLPDLHIVDRYFMAAKYFGIQNDGMGLDYFISNDDAYNPSWLPPAYQQRFVAFVTGGRHKTKILPPEKIVEVCSLLHHPVVLLGGPEDTETAEQVAVKLPGKVFNACGMFSLNRSAAIVKQSAVVITNDTGLMHIAAAFRKNIISIWGNTVPEFGMHPYLPVNGNTESVMFEVKNLSCRPCSKIGYSKCPKKHFDCMNRLDAGQIAGAANALLEKNV